MPTSSPLSALRGYLEAHQLDGIIVPRADAWQSEYAAPHDDKLAWLSGFTGSAGTALVLKDRALIFVDGRYQVQVRNEVDLQAWDIHHLHNDPLENHLPANARIAFDPMLMVNSQFETLNTAGAELVALTDCPFNALWHDRPAAPTGAIRDMPLAVAGESSASKRTRIAALLDARNADFLAVTQPDNIAWLLNVRGSDIATSPVPLSFVLISRTGDVEWFVDAVKTADLPQDTLADLTLSPMRDLVSRCQQIAPGKRVMLDADSAPVALRFAVEKHEGEVLWGADPMTFIKAGKNDTELAGYRDCHRQDGAAWVNFLAWLAHEVPARIAAGNPLTELEAQARQLALRELQPNFIEQSFGTISAAGANAAMCHYHSSEATNAAITADSFYLNDSGGQYHNGTTDATRTLAFGPLDPQRKLHYTAVLKGFLSLITLQFPSGSFGHQIDAFARRALWELGVDFDHGTGHGVGHQLLIHEAPHRIARKVNPWPLAAGNIITIEPGYYREGEYGIRIENQVEVVDAAPGFCKFATLTLIPIDLSQVEISLLSEQEKQWLDEYHQQVRDTLSPLVESEARPWLFTATAPVRVQRG